MKQRQLKYDVIRVIALCMVLMVHVSAYMVTTYPETLETPFRCSNILNGFSRAGTPMFLMLTGALLLDENRNFDTQKFYKKSLLRICLLLMFWLFFYATWRAIVLHSLENGYPDWQLFFDYLLQLKGQFPHLWYLFMLIGSYTAIPVLRFLTKKENKTYILGIILLAVVVQFVTQTMSLFTRNMEFTLRDFVNKFHMEYASGYLSYLLVGWYLTTFTPKKKTRFFLGMVAVISLIVIILTVQFGIDEVADIRSYIAEMDTLPAILYGIGFFVVLCETAGSRTTKNCVIEKISQASFGVYIIHVFFLDILLRWGFPYRMFGGRHALLYILILWIVDYVISFGTVLFFSHVKGIRKLFRY